MKDVHKMTLSDYETKVGMRRNGECDGDEITVEAGNNDNMAISPGNRIHNDEDDDIGADADEIVLQGEAQVAISGVSANEGKFKGIS